MIVLDNETHCLYSKLNKRWTLMNADMSIMEVDEPLFERTIEKPRVLVEFFATWCGPCRILDNRLVELAQIEPNLTIIKVNIEQCKHLTEKYRVVSIPTLIYIEQTDEVNRHVGTIDIQGLQRLVKPSLIDIGE